MRGTTAVLALITVAALLVAFGSSTKAKRGVRSLEALRQEAERLKVENLALEEALRQVQTRYRQEAFETASLQQVLTQEQERTKALTEELKQERERLLKGAPQSASQARKAR